MGFALMVNRLADIKYLWSMVRDYPNVVGYAPTMQRKLVRMHPRRRKSFRVFVSFKVPEHELEPEEVIPKTLDGYDVDVVGFYDYFRDELMLRSEITMIDNWFLGNSSFFYHS